MTSSGATEQRKSHPSGKLIGGRYSVQAPLGKGGAAQIYRVLDTGNDSQLALKQLHASAAVKLRQLFELEYRTLASFDHPHTVRVYEFGHDQDGPFYTMELLEGGDLSCVGALSWRTACGYLADTAQALALLHVRSLIHRDVSPRNLWLTPDGRVKLIDFGALSRFGAARLVIGTPPCIPPEALERRDMDQRTDLYALGAVAYYLLTGRHAYPARELSDLQLYWGTTPMLPSQCVQRLGRAELEPVPRELDTLVLSLLQRNAQARPSSCGEVLDRLHSLLGQAHDSDVDAALARLTNTGFVG
ncbi:MAG TPA: serine/threonine-protein kinase, partial [Polyangiales bacterium]|nr:serine/threonine-protein kinase [Polyangiales bacterium]